MRPSVFDLVRFWALLTGVALAAWYFVADYLDAVHSQMLPMLVTAIGGFELYLFGQDLWMKWRRSGG
jgi:hypothetical protein